jgi:hypothetical protein
MPGLGYRCRPSEDRGECRRAQSVEVLAILRHGSPTVSPPGILSGMSTHLAEILDEADVDSSLTRRRGC